MSFNCADHSETEPSAAVPTWDKTDGLTASSSSRLTQEIGCGLDDALRRLDGDLDVLREIADIFLSITPARMVELRDSLQQGNVSTVAEIAHRLSGSLGNFARNGHKSAAFELERMARTGSLQGAGDIYAALEAEIDNLSLSLRRL